MPSGQSRSPFRPAHSGCNAPPFWPPRVRETDGHIPREWLRRTIWAPACAAAGLAFSQPCVTSGTRTRVVAPCRGCDIQVVKESLGHATIAATERYLHALPDADETALDALSTIRTRRA